ncbi:MAG: LCP family protein [Ktedonobacteraceae bacterium]|nr:LCP family protein [Ktedonobacteraceae bacterium]
MANNNYGSNYEPTRPIFRPDSQSNAPGPGSYPDQPQPQSPGQGQGQQGKLILGSFKNQPGQARRQPYQYQPSPPYPYRQNAPGGAPSIGDIPPGGTPYAPYAPYQQPGQVPGTPAPRSRRRRRGRGCAFGCLALLVILAVVGVFTFTTAQRVLAFGSAISTQPPLSTETGYMSTTERTNLLVLGYGGTGHDGALLTDSILVVSVLPQSHHTSLISIPRDLKVQVPANSGRYGKINSVYAVESNFGKDPKAGGDAMVQKAALITGLDAKSFHWMTINFNGFREFIDAIGGVDVYVPASFTANYPVNDDPAINASWKKVHFEKGNQHMNGEQAIEYARARYVLDNLAEGTDFARSARQQIIVKAALAKVKDINTWPKLYNAMDALQKAIYTNMSLADLGLFQTKMDLNDPKAARIGLSTSNVLVDDGSFNLIPRNNNWQLIIDYIKQHLYN